MHPAVLEFARIIRGERRFLLPLYAGHCREDTKAHQDLKTVADTEDQFTIAQELAQGTLQAVAQLRGQDNPRRDVIAKRKSAGNDQDMKTLELLRLGNEIAHVHTRGRTANRGEVEGMGGLILAVDTIAGHYEDLGTFHRCSYTERRGKISGRQENKAQFFLCVTCTHPGAWSVAHILYAALLMSFCSELAI